MQTMVCSIQWGNMTLALDQPAFQEGYIHGRQYYFEDAWDEQTKKGMKQAITSSHLLSLIATLDECGRYQIDDGCDKSSFLNGVEELLGVLAGYLSGPLHPETHEERTKRLSECVLVAE